MSVATLTAAVGIDPFPGLPASMKQVAMQLPNPEGRHGFRHQRQRRREPGGWLEQIFGR